MKITPGLTFMTIASTLGFLGLAVLGKGGFAAFFSQPSLTAVAIATVVMAGVAVFSRGNLSPGKREDCGKVLIAFAVIGLLGAWLPAYTDRKNVWTFDGDTIRWIGVVVFIAGGALRMSPVLVLGHRFSGLSLRRASQSEKAPAPNMENEVGSGTFR